MEPGQDGNGKSQITLFTDFLYPGMKLKGELYTESGERVYPEEVPISAELIADLKARGVKRVYYEKPLLLTTVQGKEGKIPLELLEKAFAVSEEIVSSAVNQKPLPQRQIEETVESFVERVSTAGMDTILNLLEIKDFDEYTYTHSINVALLSIMAAKVLMWPDEQIRLTGIGALLHDIGKVLVPEAVLNKQGKLTDEEFALMKKHTVYGYEIVRGQSGYGDEIQKIPLLHHECYNGSGYPFGLTGEKTSLPASLVSIADFFDAVTSKRSYKNGQPHWYALILIMKNSGGKFHPRLAVDFVNKMPEFLMGHELLPIGSFVLLNTGEIAEVIDHPNVEVLKPVVGIYIQQNRALKTPIQIRLEFDKTREIETLIQNPDLLTVLEKLRQAYRKKE